MYGLDPARGFRMTLQDVVDWLPPAFPAMSRRSISRRDRIAVPTAVGYRGEV